MRSLIVCRFAGVAALLGELVCTSSTSSVTAGRESWRDDLGVGGI